MAKSAKTITLSFEDCIIVEEPKNNLNGLFIDLTTNNDFYNEPKNEQNHPVPRRSTRSAGLKTIELNMNISELDVPTFSKRILNDKSEINNTIAQIFPTQPCCSTSLPEFSNKNSGAIPKKKDALPIIEFLCALCLKTMPKTFCFTLNHCKHDFCKECLINVIQTKHHPLTGAVKCPLEIENCDKYLKESEIKELLGSFYTVYEEQIKYNIEQSETAILHRENEGQNLLPALLTMDLESIPNLNSFECSICYTEIDVGDGILLHECLHNFCKICLIGCINAAEEFEVKCPFIEGDQSCKKFLREREIRSLLSTDDFEKHIQKSLKIAENSNELSFHCRTPDCAYFVEVGQEIQNFKCPVCQRVNCIMCKAIHDGKSCVEYQEDLNPNLKTKRLNNEAFMSEDAIKKLVQNGEAMHCPKCTIPVMKITGCDFVTCTACKLGICWATKKPRKPFNRADGTLVDGCHCKEPPLYRPCHPDCKMCH